MLWTSMCGPPNNDAETEATGDALAVIMVE